MIVNGACFSYEVPDDWLLVEHEVMVIAKAPEEVVGFTPNLVLRESRVPGPGPSTLADIAQCNLRGVSQQIRGAYVFRVEALPDAAAVPGPAERRRLWMFAPSWLEDGTPRALMMIQDLLVVDDAVAELTATVPFLGWHPQSMYETLLGTLHPLPRESRRRPGTVVDVPSADLDDWATQRDGVPREQLTCHGNLDMALDSATVVLDTQAFEAFEWTTRKRFGFSVDPAKAMSQPLIAAGLFDETGRATEVGSWHRQIMRRGNTWKVRIAQEQPLLFRVWTLGAESLLLTTVQDGAEAAGERYQFRYCPTDALPRLLLMWCGIRPHWPMAFDACMPAEEVQAKCEQGAVPQSVEAVGDAREFCEQPWVVMALTDAQGNVGGTWASTPHRGTALLWMADETTGEMGLLSDGQKPPFWELLVGTALGIGEGGG